MAIPLVLGLVFAMAAAEAAAERPVARIVVQHAPLAGFVYYEGRSLWTEMRPGDPLVLEREPDNPHDPRAIRLTWRGHMLGYVPRRDNADLARQMDLGAQVEARITALARHGNGRHRIAYEIYVPLQR